MAQLIESREPSAASLSECIEALAMWGFDPSEQESVDHAAHWLRRLGNDRRFLGDLLIDLLAGFAPSPGAVDAISSGGPQSIVLATPGRGNFCIRANIWPAADDYAMRASGAGAFGYGVAHDHNYDFLTLGYFGPGCEIENFEYDGRSVSGRKGEAVALKKLNRVRLRKGRMYRYRAHRDIHRLNPPSALSVSLKLVHTQAVQGWLNHYEFDTREARISRVLGHGPSETFLRVAVALGSDRAKDLANDFGRSHPSERMRLNAWEALAACAQSEEARDEVWRSAEESGSRLVAQVAKCRRAQLPE
ncbi:hypothetical protein [Novosphingobium pentaromativorans]|uniref:Putative transposase n=1 Tax=Novosphingobium pentaromativorans US6-1 TaxID=1088721 RepID=G6ECP7_9SPHN|nr:hypothetical protein [Novosphingobium pentaromativorans]AIT79995.1 transposase [Novosphingobium pentaromativorans US6-1]EHJ60958.1 putative transposase [Novosphingobium pentaromativorans US6-1]